MADNNHDAMSERIGAFTGAFFLFGLAALFMTNTIWPGILVLLVLTPIPILIHEEGLFAFWILGQTSIWLLGLPLLISMGLIWPGILVLAGLSALLVGIAPPDKIQAKAHERRAQRRRTMSKRKRDEIPTWLAEDDKSKRELPLPDGNWIDDEDEARVQRSAR
jgi:hypothetical protein